MFNTDKIYCRSSDSDNGQFYGIHKSPFDWRLDGYWRGEQLPLASSCPWSYYVVAEDALNAKRHDWILSTGSDWLILFYDAFSEPIYLGSTAIHNHEPPLQHRLKEEQMGNGVILLDIPKPYDPFDL